MSKRDKLRAASTKPASHGTPLIVLAAIAGGAILAYFIGFLTFWQQHPLHWLLAFVGGGVGWLIGKLIYRLRGDTDII